MEILEKIREARKNHMSDFTYIDHDGEQVEVHIQETDTRIASQFDYMT